MAGQSKGRDGAYQSHIDWKAPPDLIRRVCGYGFDHVSKRAPLISDTRLKTDPPGVTEERERLGLGIKAYRVLAAQLPR